MGRPINKKYFGNTNAGATSTSSDNGIGGEGVASAAITVAGSYTTLRPTFTFSAPQIVTGVTATGTITSEVLSATISGGTGYGNAQTFDLTVTTAGGSAVLNVTSTAGGAITTVNSITSRGSFAGISAVTSVSGGTGTGAVPVLTYRAKSVTITNSGSGYTSVTVSGYVNQGGITVATLVLTSNRQNALSFLAWVPTATNGTLNTGGSAVLGDIVKQQGTKRYYVKTAQGYGVCNLTTGTVTRGALTVIASDWNGNTYWVTRLESRKARLWRKTQSGSNAWVYATGDLARWSLNAATGTNKTVVGTLVNIPSV